jgi:hypothetical protein
MLSLLNQKSTYYKEPSTPGGFFYYICITLVIPKQSKSDLIAPFYTDGVFL